MFMNRGSPNRSRKHRLRGGQVSSKPVSHLKLELLEDRCLLSIDPILEWNAVAIQVNQTSYSGFDDNDQGGPTRSSRAMAIEHVAMFDAWNSIHPDYTPYLVQAPNADNASDVAAVAQAAHDTLVALYPHQQALVDTALTQTLRRLPDGTPKSRGIAVGQFVAQAILAARANDSSQSPAPMSRTGFPATMRLIRSTPTKGS